MGYDTSHTGHITITPPLTWAEVRSAAVNVGDVRLVLDENTTDTDHGRTTVITATGITPLTNESYKGYAVQSEIQRLVDAHPEHEFAGRIDCQGADGELWRYVIRGREVVRVEPRIVWPDEA